MKPVERISRTLPHPDFKPRNEVSSPADQKAIREPVNNGLSEIIGYLVRSRSFSQTWKSLQEHCQKELRMTNTKQLTFREIHSFLSFDEP